MTDTHDFALDEDDDPICVQIQDSRWRDVLPDIAGVIRATVQHVLQDQQCTSCEITVVLESNPEVRRLNHTYRGKDKPTNILSFPYPPTVDAPDQLRGDLVLAYETIQEEAEHSQKSIDHHLRHLIIHGVLHLLEYDHEDDAEAAVMEALEVRLLQALGIDNPYE